MRSKQDLEFHPACVYILRLGPHKYSLLSEVQKAGQKLVNLVTAVIWRSVWSQMCQLWRRACCHQKKKVTYDFENNSFYLYKRSRWNMLRGHCNTPCKERNMAEWNQDLRLINPLLCYFVTPTMAEHSTPKKRPLFPKVAFLILSKM